MPDLGTNGPPPSRQRRLRAAATMRRLWVLARGNVRQEDIKVHEDQDVILVTPPIHVALPDASLIVMMEQATYSPEEERHLVEAAPSFDPLIVAQSQHTTLLMPVSSVGAATTASVSTPSSEDHLQTVEEETTEAAHEYPTGAQSSTLHTEEEERPKVCCVSAEAGHAQETAHDVPVPQSKRRKKKASIAAIAVEPPSAGCPILCTRGQQLSGLDEPQANEIADPDPCYGGSWTGRDAPQLPTAPHDASSPTVRSPSGDETAERLGDGGPEQVQQIGQTGKKRRRKGKGLFHADAVQGGLPQATGSCVPPTDPDVQQLVLCERGQQIYEAFSTEHHDTEDFSVTWAHALHKMLSFILQGRAISQDLLLRVTCAVVVEAEVIGQRDDRKHNPHIYLMTHVKEAHNKLNVDFDLDAALAGIVSNESM